MYVVSQLNWCVLLTTVTYIHTYKFILPSVCAKRAELDTTCAQYALVTGIAYPASGLHSLKCETVRWIFFEEKTLND